MKFKVLILVGLTFPCLIAFKSHAGGLVIKNTPPARATVPAKVGDWAGSWQDKNSGAEAMMTIRKQDSFLDILGKDSASIYRTTCLIDFKIPTQANCVGEGTNHLEDSRFLYRSQLLFTPDGMITEEWSVDFGPGSREGKATFQKLAKDTER